MRNKGNIITKKMVDISGHRFGMLTAIEPLEARSANGQVRWICQCDCGGTKIYTAGQLRQGNAKSCGCLKSSGTEKTEPPLTVPPEFANCAFVPDGKFEKGCVILTDLLCARRGKCSFYLPPEKVKESHGKP